MNREQAQAEFGRMLTSYGFAPGCGDLTPRPQRRPSGSSSNRPPTHDTEIATEYPGDAPAPRNRLPRSIDFGVAHDYPGEPVRPTRRDVRPPGRPSTSGSRDPLYAWVFENVVRQIVLAAEHAAARHRDRRIGVSCFMVQGYDEDPTGGRMQITMQVSARLQGREPAEVFNVVARRRGHEVQVSITYGSGSAIVSGLEQIQAGRTHIRTTSRMTAGAPTVVQPRPRPHGGPNPARPH